MEPQVGGLISVGSATRLGGVIDRFPTLSSIVAVTEAQKTQQALTALILLLLVVAGLLALLTLWYWRHTSPKRRMRRYATHVEQLADGHGYETGYTAATYGDQHYADSEGPYHDAGQPYYR